MNQQIIQDDKRASAVLLSYLLRGPTRDRSVIVVVGHILQLVFVPLSSKNIIVHLWADMMELPTRTHLFFSAMKMAAAMSSLVWRFLGFSGAYSNQTIDKRELKSERIQRGLP